MKGHPVIEQGKYIDILKRFESGLNPEYPEQSLIPARILGYGEISTIFEILHADLESHAYKRMPIFRDISEIDRYEAAFIQYNRMLSEEIGITVPEYSTARVCPATGNKVVYIVQGKLPAESLCHRLIHRLDRAELKKLLILILRHMARVWEFNSKGGPIVLGLDGQLSNWAIRGHSITEQTGLYYIDTSTPLMRVNGKEQLEPDLFLRSAPSFLVWIIKAFFLQDVLDRYYDLHLVTVDLIANLYKEQRPDLVAEFIDTANSFLSQEAGHLGAGPIMEKEVRSYYREDAFIWRLFLALRKLDRFISTRILHRQYPYILPGKIKR